MCPSQSYIELDHQCIEYGSDSTTLACKISVTEQSNCSVSQILSYPSCQQNDEYADINIDMRVTLSPESLHQISGELTDFSQSDQPTLECPCRTLKYSEDWSEVYRYYAIKCCMSLMENPLSWLSVQCYTCIHACTSRVKLMITKNIIKVTTEKVCIVVNEHIPK